MAQLESEFQYSGRLGNVTAYRMRGVDKSVVRKKGGATKERIRTESAFARTRENNTEFGGRAQGVRRVRRALHPLTFLGDYNFTGFINRILTYMQLNDPINNRGKRSILFSQYGTLLEGFSLNRYTTLESLIRTPFTYGFSRETLTAKVNIPQLLPGINFVPPKKHPLFQVVAVLGVVPDLFFTEEGYLPSSEEYPTNGTRVEASTPWMPAMNEFPGTTLEAKLPSAPPDHACAFVLSIGIRFGVPDGQGVTQTEHAGCARIFSVISNRDTTL